MVVAPFTQLPGEPGNGVPLFSNRMAKMNVNVGGDVSFLIRRE